MKVIVDEHLPPRLARALNELFGPTDQVLALTEKFGPGVKDVDWIETLSREGRWVVISADRRITRNRAEFHAFRHSRLIGFFLSRGLYKSKLGKQAERIIALWADIAVLADRVEGGANVRIADEGTNKTIENLGKPRSRFILGSSPT